MPFTKTSWRIHPLVVFSGEYQSTSLSHKVASVYRFNIFVLIGNHFGWPWSSYSAVLLLHLCWTCFVFGFTTWVSVVNIYYVVFYQVISQNAQGMEDANSWVWIGVLPSSDITRNKSVDCLSLTFFVLETIILPCWLLFQRTVIIMIGNVLCAPKKHSWHASSNY